MAANINDLSQISNLFPDQLSSLETRIDSTKEEAQTHSTQCGEFTSEASDAWRGLLNDMKAFGETATAEKERVATQAQEVENDLTQFQQRVAAIQERLEARTKTIVDLAKETSENLAREYGTIEAAMEESKVSLEGFEDTVETAQESTETAAEEIPSQMKEMFRTADSDESELFERLDDIRGDLTSKSPLEGGTNDLVEHLDGEISAEVQAVEDCAGAGAGKLQLADLAEHGSPESLKDGFDDIVECVNGLEETLTTGIDEKWGAVLGESEAITAMRETIEPIVNMLPGNLGDLGETAKTYSSDLDKVQ